MRGYHLTGIPGGVATYPGHFEDVVVELPQSSPASLHAAMDAARDAATRHLRTRTLDDLLAPLDHVVANWLCPEYPLRRLAEQALPAVTGFSAAMIRHGVPLLLAPLRAEAIRTLLHSEQALEGHTGRGPLGPGLITHVMSGNIPALAAAPILLSLTLRSATLIKCAAGDPLSATLFADSISEVDDELGQCVLATHWSGGHEAMEAVAFGGADLVVASGSDAAIAAIARRVRGRFIGHGHKISFAAVGRECLGDRTRAADLARRLAYDVSLWDQQGCLSPQLCYVETGGRITATDFAELLAGALTHYARELPPRTLRFEDRAAILRFRQAAQWGAHGAAALLASPGTTDWSISVESTTEFLPSCLNRCIRLKEVGNLAELPTVLVAHRRYLEAAGIAAGAQRVDELTAMLAQCGVHHICPIGTMQLPTLTWRQGGRPRIAEWVVGQ